MTRRLLATTALLGCALAAPWAQAAKVTPLETKALSGIPGKEGTMLTVEYGPGESDAIHRHDAHVFVYVLQGAVIMQVRGGEPVRLAAGQTFYESPGDVHVVGRNASKTRRAKFVVFMVKDIGAPPLKPAQ